MKYKFHIDKILTADIELDLPADSTLDADELAAQWARENWRNIGFQLACVQYVNDSGEEENIYDGNEGDLS